MITAGKIRSANRTRKQHIPDKRQPVRLMDKDDMARRVARAVNDAHRLLTHRYRIAIGKPAVRRKAFRARHAKHHALGLKLINPELILLMRPFDGHTELPSAFNVRIWMRFGTLALCADHEAFDDRRRRYCLT